MAPHPHHASRAIRQALSVRRGHQPEQPAASTTTGDEIRLALQTLRQDGLADKVACNACRVLQSFMRTDQDCQVALEADAVPILARTLFHHGPSLTIMMNGMSALLRLAVGSDQAKSELMRKEVLSSLICSMRQHKSQWDVTALSLALLVNLSTMPKSGGLLFAEHAVDLAIDSMLTHPRIATIQCLGCELVFHMAEGPAGQQQLLAMGAVETIVEAVRSFPEEGKLQQRALPTLGRLCEMERTRTIIGQAGGVAALLHAVDCNCEDLEIARYGCALLWELALCAAARQQMAPGPVRALVRKVLSRHPRDPVLAMSSQALLWKVVGRSPPPKLTHAKQATSSLGTFKQQLAQHTVVLSPQRPTAACGLSPPKQLPR